jgi:hypothetical protein
MSQTGKMGGHVEVKKDDHGGEKLQSEPETAQEE